jgi:hypothetical protein
VNATGTTTPTPTAHDALHDGESMSRHQRGTLLSRERKQPDAAGGG